MTKKSNPDPTPPKPEEADARLVDPDVPVGKPRKCALTDFDKAERRTKSQVYTIYYLFGRLKVSPAETAGRIQELLQKYGADDIETCTTDQANSIIQELRNQIGPQPDLQFNYPD